MRPGKIFFTYFYHHFLHLTMKKTCFLRFLRLEYIVTVLIASVLLIGATALTLFWVIYYRDGFAWTDNPKIQFNLHPVLMVTGFITLSGFCKSCLKKKKGTKLHYYYYLSSDFTLSIVSMFKAYICKAGTHSIPYVSHSMCCHWILSSVRFT